MILKSESEPTEVVEPEVPAVEGDDRAGTEIPPPVYRKSRRERAVDRATEELQRELRETKERLAAFEAKKEPAKEAAQPKPTRANFANDEQFEDALVAWGAEKAIAEKRLKDAQTAQERECARNLRNYGAQVKEAKSRYEDWDEVVNQELYIGRDVQLAILELDNGADVIYFLGSNPAYATKLGEMSPAKAIMEVGHLSRRLNGVSSNGEAYESRRPKPRVPAPVRTVSTGGSSAALTFAEIAAKPAYAGKARDLKIAAAAERS